MCRFPIAVAVTFSSMMYVWHWTSRLKRRRAVGLHVALEHFFAPGTARPIQPNTL